MSFVSNGLPTLVRSGWGNFNFLCFFFLFVSFDGGIYFVYFKKNLWNNQKKILIKLKKKKKIYELNYGESIHI